MLKLLKIDGPAGLGAALGTALLAASPAQAQSQSGERVFVDLGTWTILERPAERVCTLTRRNRDLSQITYSFGATGPARLTIQTGNRPNVMMGELTWSFDEIEIPGRAIATGVYSTAFDGSAVVDAFRSKRMVSLRQSGATIASFSLDTSSAGFRLLEQCADQWRSRHGRLGAEDRTQRSPAPPPNQQPPRRAASAPPPAPPPATSPATSPARGAPRPAAQAAIAVTQPVPRDQSRWIPDDAYARIRTSSWDGGVLDFTLFVTPEGRVSRCIIDEPSGSDEYDDVTCRQLQRRARFDPARDAQGRPVEGRYSSSVEFQIPD